MENKAISEILYEIADFLGLEDFPTARFEVRAYKKAALTIETLQEPIEEVYNKGGTAALMELPGVGKSIAGLIEEYLKTGKSKKYEMMKKKYPFDMRNLTAVTGLGAKKALTLYKKLGVRNIDDLKRAIDTHKVSKLEGFGEKSEEVIKHGLEMKESSKGRMLIIDALPAAEAIVEKLRKSGLVEKVMIAGSARRMRETVGDMDILAISKKAPEVMRFFTSLPEVESILSQGPTKATVWLKMGIQCDLRALEPESFGAAVQYFTGSRDHNVQVRTIAVKLGYKLNEYGLFDRKNKNVGGVEEESIYEKLGMQWMPPEMREARGEVELALRHKIPKLVEMSDIKGDLHTHTKETDGANSIQEMAAAAVGLGYKYIATTNHTKSLVIAKGMDEKGFIEYFKRVDKLNDDLNGELTILKGAEVDILRNGKLDLDKNILKEMDCVVGATHSRLAQVDVGKETMTDRAIKAMDTGLVHVLAHPTGRIIGEREQFQIDLEKVAEVAERNNVALEINASNRMDLNDTNIMLTSKYKILYSIATDAHRTQNYMLMRYGVGTARRGWLTKDRILNAMPLDKLRKLIGKR